MKLWVFGDSYSIPLHVWQNNNEVTFTRNKYDTNWITEVAKSLSVTESNVFSQFGVSNEWIFEQVMMQAENFGSDDYVIIQLTNSNRHWFFPEHPQRSNFNQSIVDVNTDSTTKKVIKAYISHLQNDHLDSLIYSAIIYSFMYVRTMIPSIKMLLLPGFGAAPNSIGNLSDNVCDIEFKTKEIQQLFYDKTGFDSRLNHMTIDNHYVLADKVVNSFINNTPLDLTTGFKANIYT